MVTVTFADLTHTGVGVSANNNPLAVGYIAAYARTHLGSAIEPRLFKYPDALSRSLKREAPAIACFTNYMWNEQLSCAFARQIKRHLPRTIIVMGGPNYPIDAGEQRAYLETHPEIDFFIDGEGELPFVALFQALVTIDFDANRLRASGVRLPGVHYLVDGAFIRTEPAPRILDLDRTLPSPYTMGLLDEFFDDKLTPMMQTSRGCPYSCTFCHDGIAYMNKTRAFSLDRVREELTYIAGRVQTPTLQLADLNWGMFAGDLQTAELIAEGRRRTGWPRNVMVATAKNQKERIVEMSRILGDVLQVGASVQSTDPEVLHQIKRTNISLDAIVKMGKGAASNGKTGSFSEIILGLPGDTKAKHVKSVCDMLDAGIQDLRLFQFILLPGTEGADQASRARFTYDTGFRVLARCFGRYEILGDDVPAAEVQEICLGNNTMPHGDYHDCRAFDLTVAIFNNGGIVKEFFRLIEALGLKRSMVLDRIHRRVNAVDSPLQHLYQELRTAETRNFFPDRQALDEFLARPGTIDRYLRGEFGVNHIFTARTAALLTLFDVVAGIARDAVRAELEEHDLLDPMLEKYVDELLQVVIASKTQLTELNRSTEMTLHFDFSALHAADYLADPRHVFIARGLRFVIQHTEAQRADLRKYFAQYGEGSEGIGWFLQRNDSHLGAVLYRAIEYGEPFAGMHLPIDAPVAAVAPVPGDATQTRRVLWAKPVDC
jgi:radical SAM superfamily enzyme YgiQ (UPF0313 family)